MSKKSRKRNKKILAMLALAGGAAMAGRRKGTPAADVDSGRGGDSASAAARVLANTAPAVTGVVKPKVPVVKKVIIPDTTITRTSGIKPPGIGAGGVDARGLSRGQLAQIMAAKANAPRGVIRPGSVPMQRTGVHPRASGAYKSGGSVTGIAKRGFGRALMKGKK